jgi:hypothetical protein
MNSVFHMLNSKSGAQVQQKGSYGHTTAFGSAVHWTSYEELFSSGISYRCYISTYTYKRKLAVK